MLMCWGIDEVVGILYDNRKRRKKRVDTYFENGKVQ